MLAITILSVLFIVSVKVISTCKYLPRSALSERVRLRIGRSAGRVALRGSIRVHINPLVRERRRIGRRPLQGHDRRVDLECLIDVEAARRHQSPLNYAR